MSHNSLCQALYLRKPALPVLAFVDDAVPPEADLADDGRGVEVFRVAHVDPLVVAVVHLPLGGGGGALGANEG